MTDLKRLDDELNQLTASGQILEALAGFYADDCVFQEGNQEPRIGRPTQHAHLSSFFATLREFRGATLHSQAVGDGVTLTEWTFEMIGPDGPLVWNEVLRRQWLDDKVVSERYYQAA